MASFYFANRRSRILHGDTPSSSNNLIMDEFHSRPVILNGATSKVKVGYIGYTKIAPPILEQEKPVGSLLIERRVPVKVEPKVFLANERTFLAWMHSSLWLFGASITILKYSFGDPLKIMYGAMIMLVALVFIFYSIFQCTNYNKLTEELRSDKFVYVAYFYVRHLHLYYYVKSCTESRHAEEKSAGSLRG